MSQVRQELFQPRGADGARVQQARPLLQWPERGQQAPLVRAVPEAVRHRGRDHQAPLLALAERGAAGAQRRRHARHQGHRQWQVGCHSRTGVVKDACRIGVWSTGVLGILDMNIGLFILFLNKIIPRNNTECFIGIFSI